MPAVGSVQHSPVRKLPAGTRSGCVAVLCDGRLCRSATPTVSNPERRYVESGPRARLGSYTAWVAAGNVRRECRRRCGRD